MTLSLRVIRDLYFEVSDKYPEMTMPQFTMLQDICVCECVLRERGELTAGEVERLVQQFQDYNNLLTGHYIKAGTTPAFDNNQYTYVKKHGHLKKVCQLRLEEYKTRNYLNTYTISRELLQEELDY